MSTRALVRFVGGDEAGAEARTEGEAETGPRAAAGRDAETPTRTGPAQVYKHADGDPGRLLARLCRTEAELDRAGAHRGPGYAAAQFLYLDKRDCGTPPGPLFGHAVVDSAAAGPGDAAYRYRVEVGRGGSGSGGGDAGWRVAVSERRGFAPGEPFGATRWQFRGPLPAAAGAFGE